jgi:hypothetical protein
MREKDKKTMKNISQVVSFGERNKKVQDAELQK